MPALLGRKVRIQRSADGSDPWTTIAGARTDKINFSRQGVDISDKDDGGFRVMLGDVAELSVSMNVEGVFKDKSLIEDALDPDTALFDYRVDIEGIGTITGDYFLADVELGAEHRDGAMFSAKLDSSGTIVWADAP